MWTMSAMLDQQHMGLDRHTECICFYYSYDYHSSLFFPFLILFFPSASSSFFPILFLLILPLPFSSWLIKNNRKRGKDLALSEDLLCARHPVCPWWPELDWAWNSITMATALPAWVVAWYHVGLGWQMSGSGTVPQEGATICLKTSLFSGQQRAHHIPATSDEPSIAQFRRRREWLSFITYLLGVRCCAIFSFLIHSTFLWGGYCFPHL